MRSAFGMTFEVPGGYLNTPSIGVPPTEAVTAMNEAVAKWGRGGDAPGDFDGYIERTRELYAHFAGVPAERVTAGNSLSGLVALVAASLPDGARVLVADGDFTSVVFPFAAHADRGVTVTEAELSALPELAAGYDLVAVSVVQSADGRIVDLDALREATAGIPTRVLLDTTQAAGWLPLQLEWADYVAGACYKWLLSPRGAAWMAVRPDIRLRPIYANWFSGTPDEDTNYGLPLRLADGARGLDQSPVWLQQVGAEAAMRELAKADLEQVRRHCVGLADELRAQLGMPPGGSAIVGVPGADAGDRLTAAGVVSSPRAGKARVGFHLYNTADDLDRVIFALRA